MRHALGALIVSGVLALACGVAQADVFKLTSPALEDNGTLAVKNGGNNKQNANCVGDNTSPPLAWSNPPDGTKSYALLMFDPEGRGGAGVSHMVIYGIPATVTSFAEGEMSQPSDKYIGGKSAMGLATYFGPCPPTGVDWHHYTLVLIATDLDPKDLQPGMTREEFLAVLSGHAKGTAGLIGRFRHP
jgi:Raf kinase inhibitor-like YbhB/YbcL family protein